MLAKRRLVRALKCSLLLTTHEQNFVQEMFFLVFLLTTHDIVNFVRICCRVEIHVPDLRCHVNSAHL